MLNLLSVSPKFLGQILLRDYREKGNSLHKQLKYDKPLFNSDLENGIQVYKLIVP